MLLSLLALRMFVLVSSCCGKEGVEVATEAVTEAVTVVEVEEEDDGSIVAVAVESIILLLDFGAEVEIYSFGQMILMMIEQTCHHCPASGVKLEDADCEMTYSFLSVFHCCQYPNWCHENSHFVV